jgi:hypothetical protein
MHIHEYQAKRQELTSNHIYNLKTKLQARIKPNNSK